MCCYAPGNSSMCGLQLCCLRSSTLTLISNPSQPAVCKPHKLKTEYNPQWAPPLTNCIILGMQSPQSGRMTPLLWWVYMYEFYNESWLESSIIRMYVNIKTTWVRCLMSKYRHTTTQYVTPSKIHTKKCEHHNQRSGQTLVIATSTKGKEAGRGENKP